MKPKLKILSYNDTNKAVYYVRSSRKSSTYSKTPNNQHEISDLFIHMSWKSDGINRLQPFSVVPRQRRLR